MQDRTTTRRRLTVLALALVLLTTACGLLPQGTRQVTLADLSTEQETWDGHQVITEGVVRMFEPPRHFWIEDAQQNRVELTPDEGLDDLLGATIRVEGRFTFKDDEGRRIAVKQLEVLRQARTS